MSDTVMTETTVGGAVPVSFEQALAVHCEGRTEEAAQLCEVLLQSEPAHAQALAHLGAVRLAQGRAVEAEALLRRAVAAAPEEAEAHATLAAALQAQDRLDEAVPLFERALALDPDRQDARFALAVCLQSAGRHAEALGCYEAILTANPGHAMANYGMGVLLAELGRTREAIAQYRAAIAADGRIADAHFELGKLLEDGGAVDEAIACYRRALEADAAHVEAGLALGATASRLGRNDEAIAGFRAVVAAEPDHVDANIHLGRLFEQKRHHSLAVEHYDTVLAHNPEDVEALLGAARTKRNLGRRAEALDHLHRLETLQPALAAAFCLHGEIMAETGSMAEAARQMRHAVALAPNRAEYLTYLTYMGKVRPGDGTLSALEAILPSAASLPLRERCFLHFALAKAYGDVGMHERGFTHLLQGNAIKRSDIEYPEAPALFAMERIAQVFNTELMAARKDCGDPSEVPVFIVGMPRSGTSLVEQVLASHAAVFGAGERLELSQAALRLSAGRLGATGFPEVVWTMTDEQLRQFGSEYVASLRRIAPDATHITDKMPSNFQFVGLIRLILPRARIIHVSRDPVDTCLSCFSILFTDEQRFSYDLAELGRYYRAYQGLMAHWRSVLPEEAMLEVQYETLVDDFAAQARRIVAYCGLEWDPACLEFHKASRLVLTASMNQVRQPIYRTSVGRWRLDATVLRPLLDALAGVPARARDDAEEPSPA